MRNSGMPTRSQDEQASTSKTSTFGMELDRVALTTKNAELTKEHAKLKMENAELKALVSHLRSELFEVKLKEAQMKKDIKNNTPYFVTVVNSLLKYSEEDRNVAPVNRVSLPRESKEHNVTQRVGPHMVNGIILNVSPKVSLTRINSCNGSSAVNPPCTSGTNIGYRHSVSPNSSNDNTEGDLDDMQHENFFSRRHHQNGLQANSAVEDHQLSLEDREDEEPDESEMSLNVSTPPRALSTISEESMLSRASSHLTNSANRSEMRITLTRMSIEDMRRGSFRSSASSMEAIANDTRLSIETTVIEHQDQRGGKKMGNIVLTPYSNSRRIASESPMLNEEMQSMESLRTIYSPDSRIRSSVEYLPTPSMSALGDIDSCYSRLDFSLENSGSTINPASSPKKILRQSLRSERDEVSSPLSSKENTNSIQTSFKIVNQRSRRFRVPIVVLEKLDDSSTPDQAEDQSRTELKENHISDTSTENDSNVRQSQNVERSSSCKSMKRSIKRKLAHDNSEKQSEIVPSETRPRRAAKPTVLKETSLRCKMRRT